MLRVSSSIVFGKEQFYLGPDTHSIAISEKLSTKPRIDNEEIITSVWYAPAKCAAESVVVSIFSFVPVFAVLSILL